MRMSAVRLFALGAILGLSLAACSQQTGENTEQPATSPTSDACDRDCLKGIADQFIAAMVAHDSSQAPLAQTVRYTENGQELALDDGLWGTAETLPTTKIYAVDPDQGAVVLFGLMTESGDPVVFCIRLKVGHKMVDQAEMLVARKGERLYNPDGMTPQPIFEEVEAPGTRTSAQGLIDIANKYFDGIEQETGSFVPFDEDCIRIENGEQTVKNASRGTGSADGQFNLSAMGCKEQFDTGFWAYITAVKPRRYELVDPEHGLVFGVFSFEHAGTVKSIDVPGYGKIDMPQRLLAPYNSLIGELFKVRDGKILKVEALVVAAPFGMKQGWE